LSAFIRRSAREGGRQRFSAASAAQYRLALKFIFGVPVFSPATCCGVGSPYAIRITRDAIRTLVLSLVERVEVILPKG